MAARKSPASDHTAKRCVSGADGDGAGSVTRSRNGRTSVTALLAAHKPTADENGKTRI